MSDLGRIRGNPTEQAKTASPVAAQATIVTPSMSQHGLKQAVSPPWANRIVAFRHYIEDGKLMVTPVRHSEMYIERS